MGALLETQASKAIYVNPAHVTFIEASEHGLGLVDLHLTDDPSPNEQFIVKGSIHSVAKALGWS
jgi:hypothetical protein